MYEEFGSRTTCGDITYMWQDEWAKLPVTESSLAGWAHHGIVVTDAGSVITFHQSDRRLLELDAGGNLVASWQTDFTEAHGMTLVKDGGGESLWIADNGSKRRPELNYEYGPQAAKTSGLVALVDLEGRVVKRLPKPGLAGYDRVRYSPTSVAVDEEGLGGSGDVWVADGYGLSCVHRFDKRGDYVGSIDGSEGGAGRFNTPHGVSIDRRRGGAELYIADRANRRIQVYDLQGRFKRSFGSGFLTSPSGFATHGELLFVAELRARVTVLDIEDNLVCYLGSNEPVCGLDGWPNRREADGRVVRSDRLQTGKFNSPHGIATDKFGNVYVAEWLIGGRIVKLART